MFLKYLLKFPSSKNPQLSLIALKNFCLRTWTQALFFLQNATLLMFDSAPNTSLSRQVLSNLYSYPMLASYVLHQTHLEFWHIQHSVFQVYAGIFNHIQRY